MPRDIKFRGKRTDTGEWIYGLPYKEHLCGGFIKLKIQSEVEIAGETTLLFEVDPETVGQFTGVCDENDKEIYEGDTLAVDGKMKNEVVFIEGSFCHKWLDPYVSTIRRRGEAEPLFKNVPLVWKVIGNTTDNPDLLKEAK